MESLFDSDRFVKNILLFEEKVSSCQGKFSVDVLNQMLKGIFSNGEGAYWLRDRRCNNLRDIRLLLRDAKEKIRQNRFSDNAVELSAVVQYIEWFLKLLAYLRNLKRTFVETIYYPVVEVMNRERRLVRADDRSPSPSLSELSPVTGDSGFSADTPIAKAEGRAKLPSILIGNSSHISESRSTTPQIVSCPDAIGELFTDYEMLKNLFDFREQDRVADRLTMLMENLEMLFNENRIDIELFSPDSFIPFTSGQPYVSVLRLLPDILIKLQKAAWLATKWTQLISSKPGNAMERLQLLEIVEQKIALRVRRVSNEVKDCEQKLEETVEELNFHLAREERSGELKISLFELDTSKTLLETELENARHIREQIIGYMARARHLGQSHATKQLQQHYEQNKLRRFSLANKISALDFKRKVLEQDMNIEINLKPSIVALTNSSQELCDRIEASLNAKRKEKAKLERALSYIQGNRRLLLRDVQDKVKSSDSGVFLSPANIFTKPRSRERKLSSYGISAIGPHGYT